MKERADAALARVGLDRVPWPGDGNCARWAIADIAYGDATQHKRVQAEIVQEMGKMRDELEHFVMQYEGDTWENALVREATNKNYLDAHGWKIAYKLYPKLKAVFSVTVQFATEPADDRVVPILMSGDEVDNGNRTFAPLHRADIAALPASTKFLVLEPDILYGNGCHWDSAKLAPGVEAPIVHEVEAPLPALLPRTPR